MMLFAKHYVMDIMNILSLNGFTSLFRVFTTPLPGSNFRFTNFLWLFKNLYTKSGLPQCVLRYLSDRMNHLVKVNYILTQYAHDVVLTSVRRRFNVMDVVWMSKRCRLLTGDLPLKSPLFPKFLYPFNNFPRFS